MEQEPIQEKKKRGAQKGRVMTDAQREGLKKGFEALKAKRESLKKEKEERPAEKTLTNTKPLTEPLPINNLPVVNKELVNPEPTLIPKKTRIRTAPITQNDLISLKNDILNGLKPQEQIKQLPPVIVEAPQPQPQLKAEIPKIISGHDLLNKIFFNR
jgi:hypothetical protein